MSPNKSIEQFNIFNNLVFTESSHNSLLKKLLTKSGKHNMKELFQSTFVTMVLKCEYAESLFIEREVKAGKRGYIDLMLFNENRTIIYIIENKVKKAKDRPNQLYRYWRNHIRILEDSGIHGDFKLFYLTLKGNQPSRESITKPIVSSKTKHYEGLEDELPNEVITISYKKDISDWLKYCYSKIPNTIDNSRLLVTLEQYIEWIDFQ